MDDRGADLRRSLALARFLLGKDRLLHASGAVRAVLTLKTCV